LTLQYVKSFDDFQEPCIPHQSLTRQQRRSGDQDFIKKSETRKFADFAEMFQTIFKTVSSPASKLTFCELSAFFLFAYCILYLTCTQNRQKVFQLRSSWNKQVLL